MFLGRIISNLTFFSSTWYLGHIQDRGIRIVCRCHTELVWGPLGALLAKKNGFPVLVEWLTNSALWLGVDVFSWTCESIDRRLWDRLQVRDAKAWAVVSWIPECKFDNDEEVYQIPFYRSIKRSGMYLKPEASHWFMTNQPIIEAVPKFKTQVLNLEL